MPNLIDTQTGETVVVSDAEVPGLVESGLYTVPEGELVAVNVPGGVRAEVDPAAIGGHAPLSPAQATAVAEAADREAAYGDENVTSFLEGGLSGLTLGGSDALQRALTADDPLARAAIRGRAKANPVARTAGEITGAVAPALLSGGTGAAGTALRVTPAGAASRLGQALAQQGAGRGIGRRVAAGALGGAAEGALGGAAEGIRELALSEDPVTAERAASVLSSKSLYGAGVGGLTGGAFSAAGEAAGRGIARARRYLDDAAAQARTAPDLEDLAGLDRAGLRAAKDAEIDTLKQAQISERAAAADDILAYRRDFDAANAWLAVEGQQSRAALRKAQIALRRHLDEPIGLAENPRKAIDALRREAQALKQAKAESGELAEKIAREEAEMAQEIADDLATLPDRAKTVQLTGKSARRFADWAGEKAKKTFNVSREQADEFRQALAAGEIQGQRAAALSKLDDVIARNEGLQQRIAATYETPKSARLDQIESAMDALVGGGKKGLGQQLMQGAAFSAATSAAAPLGPLAPILGAKAADAVANLALGNLRKASGEAAQRIAQAIDRVASAVQRPARAAPIVATQVLRQVSYSPSDAQDGQEAASSDLVGAYLARERELRGQTVSGPDGRTTMRPEARRQLAARLAPIRAVAPLLADRIETNAARRVEFLASKLPRRPDAFARQVGPDRWQPSDFQIRQFARYAAAVEDPAAVIERVNDGSLTPEDAEALQAVYPEIYAQAREAIFQRLAELRQTLPYEKRLTLSILMGAPVDPAMSPEIISVLQASFTDEPDTEGGTMPPRANPQFGSVAAPSPTPAQERAG